MYKKKNGFTLAELLIVVAIIAVLVAIAIPVFTTQLEKSREATDAANIRAQYAEVMVEAVATDGDVNTDGNQLEKIQLKQTKSGWLNEILGKNLESIFQGKIEGAKEPQAGGTAYVKYQDNQPILVYGDGNGQGTGGGSGYQPARVSESAKDLEIPINAVLSTLYDELVKGRIDGETGQIAYVLLENGKITTVYTYDRANDGREISNKSITSSLDLTDLNSKIQSALGDSGYTASGKARIFFDKEGNVITNTNPDGSYVKIGGQGLPANLVFKNTTDNKTTTVNYKNTETGWEKQ